jgi:lipid II:glycine glycyltransferase (peptidoglycan interpeptide bridge formation enzyme)
LRKYRKQKAYEFNAYTYPADGSLCDLKPEHFKELANSEHTARRRLIEAAHQRGVFIYDLSLFDTHNDGGQLATG